MSSPEGPWKDTDDLSQDWGLGLPRFDNDNDEDEAPELLAGAQEFDEHFGIDERAIERSAEEWDADHGGE